MAKQTGIRAGGAFFDLFFKSDKLDEGADEVRKRFAAMGNAAKQLGIQLGLAGIILATIRALVNLGREAYDAAKALNSLSASLKQVGVEMAKAEEQGRAIDLAGGNAEDLPDVYKSVIKAQHDLLTGNLQLATSYRQLGVDVDKFVSMPVDEAMMHLADTAKSYGDSVMANKVLTELLGNVSDETAAALLRGSDALKELGRESRGTFDQDRVNSLEMYRKQVDGASIALSNLKAEMFEVVAGMAFSFLPVIAELANAIALVSDKVIKLIEDFGGWVYSLSHAKTSLEDLIKPAMTWEEALRRLPDAEADRARKRAEDSGQQDWGVFSRASSGGYTEDIRAAGSMGGFANQQTLGLANAGARSPTEEWQRIRMINEAQLSELTEIRTNTSAERRYGPN